LFLKHDFAFFVRFAQNKSLKTAEKYAANKSKIYICGSMNRLINGNTSKCYINIE